MPEPVFSMVILILLLLGSWLLVRYYQRRRILAGLAYRLQFRFAAQQNATLLAKWAGLYVMQLGHARRACNFITGRQENWELTAFDYSFETGFGLDRSINHTSVVIWKTNSILPAIVALCEKSFHPLGKFSSFVSLPTRNPEFDRSFTLYSDHPEQAQPILTPELRRVMLRCRDANWEIQGPYVVCFTERISSAPQLRRLIHRSRQTAKLLSNPVTKPD